MSQERERAMTAYRDTWLAFRESLDDNERNRLMDEMDRVQPLVAPGPGAMWNAFTETLPGYNEFWRSTQDLIAANLRETP